MAYIDSWGAAVFAAVITISPCLGLAQSPRATVFIGARLIDGRGGPPIENASVVVRDGIITKVGKENDVEIPNDARVVRLAGKTLMPGLIDAHVYIALSGGSAVDDREFKAIAATQNLRSYLKFGVTTVFDLGGNPFIEGLKEALASERMIGPRLFGVKNAITSPGSYPLELLKELKLDKLLGAAHPTVQTVGRARYWVERLASEQVDAIKIFHTRTKFFGAARLTATGAKFEPRILRALVGAAHRNKLRAFVHVAVPSEAREAVLAGADVIVGAIGSSEAGAEATFRLMAARGVSYIPSLTQIEVFHTGSPGKIALAKLRNRVWSVVLDSIASPNGVVMKRRLTTGVSAASRRYFQTVRSNFKRAVAAGVRIAMGTGAGTPGVMPGASAPRELELMTRTGMTPMQAIVASTANAAEVIGQSSMLGTIEQNKLADMIVLRGNPLSNDSAFGRIELVVRGGYAFDPAGLRIE